MLRAIVNADDFGISENVNDAICLSFEKRIITNTTLMVNMPYAIEAVNMARLHGFEDRVGLHLNLTAGVPLTGGIRSMQTFCDAKGEFHAHFHQSLKGRLHFTKAESDAVLAEIEAQIKRYLAYGLPQLHIDSHHHVHTDPAVWRLIKPLLRQYGIRSIRIGRNLFPDGKCSLPNKLYKKFLNSGINGIGVNHSKYFGSFYDFKSCYNMLEDESLSEIMLHPVFSEDGELFDSSEPINIVKEFFEDNHVLLHSY